MQQPLQLQLLLQLQLQLQLQWLLQLQLYLYPYLYLFETGFWGDAYLVTSSQSGFPFTQPVFWST